MANESTTIQIKKRTLEKLKTLKEERHVATYNEIIDNLIKKENQAPDSLFGFLKGKTVAYTHDNQEVEHD